MNWGGEQEKWLQGNNNAWFFLLPDGSLHQWAGSFADSHQVGLLGTEFYDSPQQLLDTVSAPLQVEIIDHDCQPRAMLGLPRSKSQSPMESTDGLPSRSRSSTFPILISKAGLWLQAFH